MNGKKDEREFIRVPEMDETDIIIKLLKIFLKEREEENNEKDS